MIELDDDKARLDVPRIHGWLAGSYWCPGIEEAQVQRQIDGSHCLGAYHPEHGQVGFARVISDRASFAWLADVWIDEAARGAGLGRRMARWFVDHAWYAGIRRFALTTADAHGVYEALGFRPLAKPGMMMERLDPAFLARLEEDA